MLKPQLPEEIEIYRDRMWCREVELRIEDVLAAERFIAQVGFCAALADIRRPGPSLYIAVCGRRDAQMPRNVQKDPESSLAWRLKDQVMKRGQTYYAKVLKGRSTFISRDLVMFFNSLLGIPRSSERKVLSPDAFAVLKVLRREWEMATADLRKESRVTDRVRFAKSLDELQRTFKVIPSDVTYEPVFSYIWSVSEARFPDELRRKVSREVALTEIARAYLRGAGMVERGELARVTGLSPREAGLGHWALVAEEFADRVATGVYRLRGWNSLG
jgi:hypothetical protein